MKYETHSKHTSNHTHARHEPENVINVTIVKQMLPADEQHQSNDDGKVSTKQQQLIVEKEPQKIDTETQTIDNNRDKTTGKGKSTKKMLQLAKQMKTRNSTVLFKRMNDANDGVLVRNTPTDLYHKYKSDWARFKSYIPGENSRQSVRESVRAKMQHKADEPPKVWDFSYEFLRFFASMNNNDFSDLQVYVYFAENHRKNDSE